MKIKINAPVTIGFVCICLFVLFINMSTDFNTLSYFVTYRDSLRNPMTYIRWITYIFGHSDWSHFTSNMTFILLLGPMI